MSDWLEGPKSCVKCAYVQEALPPFPNGSPATPFVCRRFPPTNHMKIPPAQPSVDEAMWCYEFKAKAKE